MMAECRFPPFPSPPVGVTILPFSAFVPVGYQTLTGPSGEAIEVDASVGIKTVKVLSEEEASNKRKAKKRQRNAGNAVDATGRLIPWWEEWEEGEASRTISVPFKLDGQVSFGDRVCVAADDFRVGRTWPEIAHGVRNMWDQFRLYIGLISSIPVYKKIKNKGQVDGPKNGEEASEEEEDAPKAKQTKVVIVQDYLEQSALPGKQLEPDPDDSSVEAARLRTFLDDMEKSVKVFLSSYMRDKGLIWTERNLITTPTILHFFLRFMLRNEVFADSKDHLDNLKRALAVAATARKELPLTATLGQMLPGHFDIACKECWGTKGSMSIQISATLPPVDKADCKTCPRNDTNADFETVLQEHDVEVIPSDVVLDSITARQVMEDNLDTDNHVPVTTIPVAGDPWTAAIRAEEYTTASWTDVAVKWLMQLLGPTVFPLTMTTGIVEYSTRRIREVIAPGSIEPGKMSVTEEVLRERFHRVVISPWVKSPSEETVDFPRPVIIPGNFREEEYTWDPYDDDVTVLVDGAVAGQVVPGMGLCGTWVQMASEQGDKRHPRECYWYIESLVATFPSYYTEREMNEEAGEQEEG